MICSLLVGLAVQAPMADLWPFEARRKPDGSTIYSYDLTALKASKGFGDAREVHGDEAVKTFLKALPRQVSVKVQSPVPLTLTAGQGLELAPLATSFSLTPEGPLTTENPLEKKAGARLLAPLDPRTAKLLVGAELPLWLARQLEDRALAAVELDTEWLRRELWSKVADKAVAKAKSSAGDTREGAFALAARVLAASSCGDASRLPPQVKADAELKLLVEAELNRLATDGDSLVPPVPFSWSTELACGWRRTRALGRPFEQSRAGTAAVLVFLELLEKDPRLKTLWERTRQRRDAFVGGAITEPVLVWRAAAKGDYARALDGLGDFIDGLPMGGRAPPPLMASGTTPFTSFLTELSGAERLAAMDELSAAVADGRVKPDGSSWPVLREAALAALLADTTRATQIDSGWRDRLSGAFAALQLSNREARRGGLDAQDELLERTELTLRLNVPPHLELEPTALAFSMAAKSLDALVASLTAENLTALKGLQPDAKREAEPVVSQAKRLSALLLGLAALASVDAAVADGPQTLAARRFIASWRAEPGLTRDVRALGASFWAAGSERHHTAIVGVSRRELRVGFASPVTATVQGDATAFRVNTGVEQRYLVPVLVTTGAIAPHQSPPGQLGELKRLIDAQGRDLSKLEGILSETLHSEGAQGVKDPN